MLIHFLYNYIIIRQTNETDEEVIIEVPNITDLFEKFGTNSQKILEYLLPLEQMLHESLSKEKEVREKCVNQEAELNDLKETNKTLKDVTKKYENFILAMTHESYRRENEVKLTNLVSVNANVR